MASDDVTVKMGVDDGDFRAGISRMKSSIQGLTNEWKENEKAYKQVGDAQNAQKAKVDGLNSVLQKQKDLMKLLQDAQMDLGKRTKDNASQHDFLTKQMGKLGAEISKTNAAAQGQQRVLDNLTKATNDKRLADERLAKEEREMADTFKHSEDRLKYLNDTLKTNDDLTKANMNVLDRAKNAQKSMQTHYDGLTNSIQKQQEIRKIELERLGRMRNMTDASSKAIDEQRLKVAQATDTLSKYQASLKAVNAKISKTNPFGSGAMVQGLNQTYRAYDKLESKMHAGFQNIKSGAISASIGIAGIGAVAVKGAEKASDLQNEYVKTLNLVQTGGEDAAEAVKNVNKMQKDGQRYSVEYGKSQKEIADGYQELVKRGYSSSSALGAMRSELEASVASGDDFNDVLSVTSQVVDAYGMRSENTAKMISNTKDVVNNLAFAADMTATDFHSMGKAMEYVGDSSYNAGFKLSETSSAIGILSNHGLEADKAGTGLRKVINSITGALSDANDAQESTNEKLEKYSGKIAKAQAKIDGYKEAVANGTKTQESANSAIKKQQQYIADLQDQADSVANKKGDILSSLGIDPKKLVDANGNLRDLQTIMKEVNDKTKNKGSAERNSIFQELFGTTGQQAGIILATNNKELGELNKKVAHAADGQGYVANLAKRNMGTVKQQVAQFKEAGQAAMILIGKQMLPVISEAAVKMSKFFNSKDGQKGLQEIAKGVAYIADKLVDLISFIGAHSNEVKTFAKIFASIWAINKVGKFLGMLKDIKSAMLDLAGINILSGSSGIGKVGKAGKISSVAGEGAELAEAGVATTRVARTAGEVGRFSGGLRTAGKFLGNSAKGIGGLSIIGALPELFSGSMGGRIGGFAGTLGGGIAGAAAGSATGAAIGSVVPGVGTAVGGILGAVGGGLGSMGGGKLGRGIGNQIQKLISGKGNNKFEISLDTSKASKEAKQFRKDFDKTIKAINKNNKVSVKSDDKGFRLTKKQSDNLYNGMKANVDKYYKSKQKTESKDLNQLKKNGVLTTKQVSDISSRAINIEGKRKDSQKKILDKMKSNNSRYLDAIQKLEQKYGKNGVKNKSKFNSELSKIQSSYNSKQTKLQKSLNEKITNETKIASAKQQDILDTLKDKKIKISQSERKAMVKESKKQRDSIIENAEKTRKESVRHANKKYKDTIALADKERYENGTLTRDEYNDIVSKAKSAKKDAIEQAKKKKDGVIKHATDEHDKVVAAAESQRKAVVKKATDQMTGAKDKAEKQRKHVVDKMTDQKNSVVTLAEAQRKAHSDSVKLEASDVERAWDSHNKNVAKTFDKNSKGVNSVLNGMNKGSGKIPMIGGYATGTRGLAQDETALVGEEGFELAYHPNKGIHVLGNKGPEIRGLKAGTSILPHDMSKQFLAMVNKLPAHKDGVSGTIDKVFNLMKKGGNWIEDAADSVMDMVSKGAKSVFESLSGTSGLTDAKKADYNSGAFKSYSIESTDKGGDGIIDTMKSVFDNFKKKYEEDGGGGRGAPSGAGVERWRGQVKQALKANSLSTSTDMVDRVLRQIATESGGNEKAVQGDIGDINNATGNLARGLMQVIPPTFAANAFPGHNNPFNGYDSLLAGLNYAKKTYGPSLSFLGNGHGYEHGGIITSHQIAELGEKGKREAVIPLDISERSRAIPLLKTAVNEMSSQSNNKPSGVIDTTQTSGTDLTEVLQNMQAILNGLNDVVMAVNTSLTPARVTRAVNTQTQLNANLQSQMRGV